MHRVINCTGPDADLRRVPSPAVDDLRQGAMATESLSPASISPALCGRGRFWEHMAVPELREGVARLAQHLTELGVARAAAPCA